MGGGDKDLGGVNFVPNRSRHSEITPNLRLSYLNEPVKKVFGRGAEETIFGPTVNAVGCKVVVNPKGLHHNAVMLKWESPIERGVAESPGKKPTI